MTSLAPQLRLIRPDGRRFGPGKARLLELILQTGSITKAGQAMGMSYKRAWSLVEDMNAMFIAPVVVTTRGGTGGGGAEVTDIGRQILAHFRSLEQVLAVAGGDHIQGLTDLMVDMSDQK